MSRMCYTESMKRIFFTLFILLLTAAIFVTENGSIYTSSGLADIFVL